MPLKIRVKPEGKILAGGAVLKNVGTRPADLLVLSDGPVLRESYMMNIDRRGDSEFSNVYFLLQVIYLFRGKDQPMDNLVIETVKNFGKLYPAYEAKVSDIISLLEAKETFKALKIAHEMLDQHQKTNQTADQGTASSAEEAAAIQEV